MEENSTNRWQMNRLGFVNFWLYDNQVFNLDHGHILLRGQNGSGKSITTQSFIPFILDGDRTPSRLDPFGSNDRRMEYYFLGVHGKDESTGYLYLEFVKPQTREYRTIGIGQRAVRGRQGLYFWGFVLMDGRRIGQQGCELCKNLGGGTYVPLSKRECKEMIGAQNFFCESQKEYKEAVNKYLFGFDRIDQYDQLTSLLIKIRGSKLSKEFKPSRVYDILNDSLQTLSDNDLAPMVTAMENMDTIAARLDDLRNTASELRYILDEYKRYNRYLAARKAQNYLQSESSFKQCQSKIEQHRNKMKEYSVQQDAKQRRLVTLKEEIKIINDRLDAYSETAGEIQRARKQRDSDSQTVKTLQAEINHRHEKIDSLQGEIHQLDNDIRNCRAEMDGLQAQMAKQLQHLEEINRDVSFSHADVFAQFGKCEKIRALYDQVQREISELQRQLEQILAKLKDKEQALEQADEAEKKWAELQLACQKQTKTLAQAENDCDLARDQLIEAWHLSAARNQEYVISEHDLQRLQSLIRQYDETDLRPYIQLTEQIKTVQESVLNKQEAGLQTDLEVQKNYLKKLQDELTVLQQEKEAIPPRNDRVIRSREKLQSAGIDCIPLYEVIDFATEDSHRQAMLEKQLQAAGMLDALIVPEDQYDQAGRLVDEDTFIKAENPGEICSLFKAEDTEMPSSLLQETKRVLSCISETGGQFIVRRDGYFRNGILEGKVQTDDTDEAVYIGAARRRRAHQMLVDARQKEINTEKQKYNDILHQLDHLHQRQQILQQEKEHAPGIDDLNDAVRIRREAEKEASQARLRMEQADDIRHQKQDIYKRIEREANAMMRPYPYAQTSSGYQNALDACCNFRDAASGLYAIAMDREKAQEKKVLLQATSESKQEMLDVELSRQEKDQADVRRLIDRMQTQDQILQDPDHQKAAREIDALYQRLNQNRKETDETEKDLVRMEEWLKNERQELEEAGRHLQDASEKYDFARKYYLEDMRLNLLEDESQKDDDAILAQAGKIVRSIDAKELEREPSDINARLSNSFSHHVVSLSSTGIESSQCFEPAERPDLIRSRTVITAVLGAVKMDITAFSQEIRQNIAETEELIRKKDRELFENILSDTLSRKLTMKITESRNWIGAMSKLMKNMDSSMGLSFSLRWLPKTSLEEGELSADQLESILSRDHALLTQEDIQKVADHFRHEIQERKQAAADAGIPVNYQEMVREALDYRQWFEFRMMYTRVNEAPKELTDHAFNTFSGGEKAMAMYIPLFAAVNAQYQKSTHPDHPRLIALDEAFAGVDDKNISSMFHLVSELEFDYIMNSQYLWGCYETVNALRIAELLRPENADFITVIFYHWNGRQKVLDEQ